MLASSRLSVRPHGTTWLPLYGFSWNFILRYFNENLFEEIQVSLKSDNNERCFTWIPKKIYDKARWKFLRIINTSDTILDKITTDIICSKTFTEYRAFYEKICEILVGKTSHRWQYKTALDNLRLQTNTQYM